MNSLSRWQRPSSSPWQGVGGLSDLREEIDRLFESPFAELTRTSQLLSGWNPPIDLFEDKDSFVVRAELPGMKKEEIDLSLHEGSLSISGERRAEDKYQDAEVYRAERFFGRFQRTVSFPAPVAADQAKAQYKDGILTVRLPKTEEAKPKHIDVKIG